MAGSFLKVRSYNIVSVQTREPEKILNLIQKKYIGIWDASYEDGKLRFKVMNSSIDVVSGIASRFSGFVSIEEHLGIQRALDFVLARKVFFCLLSVFAAFTIFFSTFVWRIEIYGARVMEDEKLKTFLYENDVRPSLKKTTVDLHAIEVMILREYQQLSDATASLSGTTLKIAVVERESPIVVYERNTPVNLVADKEAIVGEITVYSGTPAVEEGSIVNKGDLLVSGAVEYVYNGKASYTTVHAMAKILAYEEITFSSIVDMYMPLEDAPYISEKIYYLFGKSYATTNGIVEDALISIKEKNKVFSLGWIETPILYDEIRWYNVKNCRTKAQEEIDGEIFALAKERLSPKQSIRSVSFQPTITENNRIHYTVVISVATNIATEQEL